MKLPIHLVFSVSYPHFRGFYINVKMSVELVANDSADIFYYNFNGVDDLVY